MNCSEWVEDHPELVEEILQERGVYVNIYRYTVIYIDRHPLVDPVDRGCG